MSTPLFRLTAKQERANALLAGPASNVMLYGGSRSGKTFLNCRGIATRAIKAPGSRHAIMRFRNVAVIGAVALDTWPKMMSLCYPDVKWGMNKQHWYAELANGSQVWFGGLDDKERAEKVLGNEYATILLTECSQIPWSSRQIALTRLAQVAMCDVEGQAPRPLSLKMYYDENPPDRSHWTHRVFELKVDPDTREPLLNPDDYASLQMNPVDNAENLLPEYLESLRGMSARMRRRFYEGEFRDANPNALFPESSMDKWRVMDGALPDMQRIIIAVDPSGAGDSDNAENDSIGITVQGLGVDGRGYLLEDLTCKAGPGVWGKVVTNAFDRHNADLVVAETNFGGAMVGQVIKTARPNTPFKEVHASRGKVVRAEPISPLIEKGDIRLVGYFPELEDELGGFTTNGYLGEGSPNRADAMVWGMSEIFPGIVTPRKEKKKPDDRAREAFAVSGPGGWMGQ